MLSRAQGYLEAQGESAEAWEQMGVEGGLFAEG